MRSATVSLDQRDVGLEPALLHIHPALELGGRFALCEIGAVSWSACRRPGCRRRRARMRSASVPCGTSSSPIWPARYFSVKARGSDERGNEQTILATMPASIIAAMPMRPLPALLLMTVSRAGLPVALYRSISAWMSSIGCAGAAEAADHNRHVVGHGRDRRGQVSNHLIHPALRLVDDGRVAPRVLSGQDGLCDMLRLLTYRTNGTTRNAAARHHGRIGQGAAGNRDLYGRSAASIRLAGCNGVRVGSGDGATLPADARSPRLR